MLTTKYFLWTDVTELEFLYSITIKKKKKNFLADNYKADNELCDWDFHNTQFTS